VGISRPGAAIRRSRLGRRLWVGRDARRAGQRAWHRAARARLRQIATHGRHLLTRRLHLRSRRRCLLLPRGQDARHERHGRDVQHADLVAAADRIFPCGKNETKNRWVMKPGAAILHYASENKWCDWRRIRKLDEAEAKTRASSANVARVILDALDREAHTAATDHEQWLARKKHLLILWLFKHGNRISDPPRLEWDAHIGSASTELLVCASARRTASGRQSHLSLRYSKPLPTILTKSAMSFRSARGQASTSGCARSLGGWVCASPRIKPGIFSGAPQCRGPETQNHHGRAGSKRPAIGDALSKPGHGHSQAGFAHDREADRAADGENALGGESAGDAGEKWLKAAIAFCPPKAEVARSNRVGSASPTPGNSCFAIISSRRWGRLWRNLARRDSFCG
jgi:hypothetical protein